ncbi:nucleoside hydrolase [filamentous cyanobacterium CCP5]|nr:nucleoside hydrolase [filamentous cyanobacterium CCP5]
MADSLKIILDTDPGGDDIFAFLWLLSLVKQGLADLAAVTAAEGNVAARKTFTNSSQILKLAGFPAIPVGRPVSQCPKPGADAGHIHGTDGMGNLSQTLPPPVQDFETAPRADDLLIEQLNASPEAITLIAIGPLTNLAAAEVKQPGILKKAKEIVVMGGAFHCPGNITPTAEFNIWFNPAAAQIVFDSRNDIVMLPLNVTRELVLTGDMAKAITQDNPNGDLAQFMVRLCQFMIGTAAKHREVVSDPGFLVHDAAAVSYLFYPEVLRLRRARVRVETQGVWTRGQTLMDDRSRAKSSANAWIALQIDAPSFFTRFIEDLKGII